MVGGWDPVSGAPRQKIPASQGHCRNYERFILSFLMVSEMVEEAHVRRPRFATRNPFPVRFVRPERERVSRDSRANAGPPRQVLGGGGT
jgi:hypothetical protein